MKLIALVFMVVFPGMISQAQNLAVGLHYTYFYSRQLDRVIQTYNFSRPFLNQKQPLLNRGMQIDANYCFNQKSKIKQGVQVAYSFMGSEATNGSYVNRFNIHLLRLNYLLRFSNPGQQKKIFMEVQVGLASTALYRRVNGSRFLVDEKPVKALGIGGNISLNVGYYLYRGKSNSVLSSACCNYLPYGYFPNYESVINATQSLVGNGTIQAFSFQLGLHVEWGINKQIQPRTP